MSNDEEILREAQAQMQDERRRQGIDPAGYGGPLPEVPATTPRADGRGRIEPLGDLSAAFPPIGRYRCSRRWPDPEGRCATTIPRPGVCDACGARMADETRAEAIRVRIATEIPREYRDARWDNALDLRGEDGKTPRLTISPREFERVKRVLRELPMHKRVVILGGAGNGKSTLAAAWARDRIESGSERVCFAQVRELLSYRRVRPDQIEPPTTIAEYAKWSEWLVMDDLGDELHNAAVDSGLASQRMAVTRTLIADRRAMRRGYVLTTGFPQELVERAYHDGTGRRIFEDAEIIELGKLLQ